MIMSDVFESPKNMEFSIFQLFLPMDWIRVNLNYMFILPALLLVSISNEIMPGGKRNTPHCI